MRAADALGPKSRKEWTDGVLLRCFGDTGSEGLAAVAGQKRPGRYDVIRRQREREREERELRPGQLSEGVGGERWTGKGDERGKVCAHVPQK